MDTKKFEELRPPRGVFKIKHSAEYIHEGNGRHGTRRIYFRVPFDEFEEQKISELQRLLAANDIHLPANWTRSHSLRFLYASKFKLFEENGCVDRIEKHVNFMKESAVKRLVFPAESILKKGIFYQYGRDMMYRPIIIANLAKFAYSKCSLSDLICAITNLLEAIRRFMLVPGLVENWVFIIDAKDFQLQETTLELLQELMESVCLNYPETLETCFLVNLPKELQETWKAFRSFVPPKTRKKIMVVPEGDSSKLTQRIEKAQLERRFGGNLPDLTENFWPPRKIESDELDDLIEDERVTQDFAINSHNELLTTPEKQAAMKFNFNLEESNGVSSDTQDCYNKSYFDFKAIKLATIEESSIDQSMLSIDESKIDTTYAKTSSKELLSTKPSDSPQKNSSLGLNFLTNFFQKTIESVKKLTPTKAPAKVDESADEKTEDVQISKKLAQTLDENQTKKAKTKKAVDPKSWKKFLIKNDYRNYPGKSGRENTFCGICTSFAKKEPSQKDEKVQKDR